ncbi:MAG: hypothetical protein MK060_20300 [Blastomonas sp.]|uniref:hypothetical protein n=1 Tax=unclassified Blastomonas TaxID=2626550 RepID=UPI0010F7AFC3|nr:hypothetical protein [Blastomonas sp.]MCH2240218.1 hypothetical protein [Blastomonas sp.]
MIELDEFEFHQSHLLEPGNLALFPHLTMNLGITIITDFDKRRVAVPLNQTTAAHDWLDIDEIGDIACRITDYTFELDPVTICITPTAGALAIRNNMLSIVVKGRHNLYQIPFKEIERSAGGKTMFFPRWRIIRQNGDRCVTIFSSPEQPTAGTTT